MFNKRGERLSSLLLADVHKISLEGYLRNQYYWLPQRLETCDSHCIFSWFFCILNNVSVLSQKINTYNLNLESVWRRVGSIVFLFARLYREWSPEPWGQNDIFSFSSQGTPTCYTEALGSLLPRSSSLSDDYRTGERWPSFSFRFLLMSLATSPTPLPTAQPRGPSGHLDLPTAKFTSTSTQKKASKTGTREMFLPQLSQVGSLGKRTWSLKCCWK